MLGCCTFTATSVPLGKSETDLSSLALYTWATHPDIDEKIYIL